MKTILTVATITYNQGEYIAQCLDGILKQKTNFKFELIISDDCSTDNTRNIIEEYVKQYPDIIKPIYRTKNMGAIENFVDTIAMAKSKYVAICEGDDYWTDPYKLQKQVDFLEANPDYSICFHPVRVTFEGYNFNDYFYPTPFHVAQGFTYENLLKYNFIQTNSVMYRWGFLDKDIKLSFPDGILPGDWFLHLLHAKLGKIGYIDEVMAVYRRNPTGIWSDSINDVDKLHIKYALKELKFYDSVYDCISENSEYYLKEVLIPKYKEIFKCLIKHKENQKLKQVFQIFPEYFWSIVGEYSLDNTDLLKELSKNIRKMFINRYYYKILSKIVFGKKREFYAEKAEIYCKKVRVALELSRL